MEYITLVRNSTFPGTTGARACQIAISTNGQIMAIGSPGVPDVYPSYGVEGSVNVYRRDDSNTTISPIGWIPWGQQLTEPTPRTAGEYGMSVALSGDGTTLAVGRSGGGHGSVYIYNFNASSNQWTKIAELSVTESHTSYYSDSSRVWENGFGASVSLSDDGTIIAIGAPLGYYDRYGPDMSESTAEKNTRSRGGTVYVYEQDANLTWNQTAQLYSWYSGPLNKTTWWNGYNTSRDEFGHAVSLSNDGKTLAVGARVHRNQFGRTNHGIGVVYENTGSGFDRNTVALQYTSDGTVDSQAKWDSYGTSVAISGNGTVFAVGAISEDEGGSNRGLVRTYKKTNDTWAQLGSNILGEADGDRSGHSVSLSDDGLTMAIGAPYNDGNQSNSGHVRVYHNTGSSSWVKYINDINGDGQDDGIYHARISGDGRTLAIGTPNRNSNAGGVDTYLMPNEPSMSRLWMKHLPQGPDDGSSGSIGTGKIVRDSNNNVYITGVTNEGETIIGGYDMYLAKYDSDGTLLWQTMLGTTENDWQPSLVAGIGPMISYVFLSFYTSGSFSGMTNQGELDVFLLKLDMNNGNLIWRKQIATSAHDEVGGITIDSDGYIYITGSTTGNIGRNPIPYQGNTSEIYAEIFLSKINSSSGSVLWNKQFGSTTGDTDHGLAITVDRSNNIYITGSSSSDAGGGPNYLWYDICTFKYNSGGTQIWKRQWGTNTTNIYTSSDWGWTIATDSNSNVYIGAAVEGSSESNGKPMVLKYDTNGTEEWFYYLTNYRGGRIHDIAIDSNNNVCIVGEAFSNSGTDFGATIKGDGDIFIRKIDGETGTNVFWETTISDIGDYDTATGIVLSSNNDIYITGYLETEHRAIMVAKYGVENNGDSSSSALLKIETGISGDASADGGQINVELYTNDNTKIGNTEVLQIAFLKSTTYINTFYLPYRYTDIKVKLVGVSTDGILISEMKITYGNNVYTFNTDVRTGTNGIAPDNTVGWLDYNDPQNSSSRTY